MRAEDGMEQDGHQKQTAHEAGVCVCGCALMLLLLLHAATSDVPGLGIRANLTLSESL
jgi:hypothetical protein